MVTTLRKARARSAGRAARRGARARPAGKGCSEREHESGLAQFAAGAALRAARTSWVRHETQDRAARAAGDGAAAAERGARAIVQRKTELPPSRGPPGVRTPAPTAGAMRRCDAHSSHLLL